MGSNVTAGGGKTAGSHMGDALWTWPGRGIYHFGTHSSGPTWMQESGKSNLPAYPGGKLNGTGTK